MALALPPSIIQQPAANYTYLATDLVTNQVLGELPVSGVTLDCQLNLAGNMTATGNLSNPQIADSDFISRTIPGRTAFWAYRNTQIVWGGIIWTRQWEAKGKVFSFTGQTFESYASRRFPHGWLGTGQRTYIEAQCKIINAMWNGMQSVAHGTIGVMVPVDTNVNDTQRTITVNGWDLSTSFDDIIQAILQYSDGPDYTIAWSEDGNGLPIKTLITAPRIGNMISNTDLIVDYPGGIQDYFYTEDASSGNNQWWATGDGSGVATATAVATDNNSLNSGWPLLEGVQSFSGTADSPSLLARANSTLKSQGMPLVVHAINMTGNASPPFGSYNMGDYVTANVEDSRFPQGAVFNVRVIGWSIVPPDTGGGVETITLVFDESTGNTGTSGA